MDVEMTTGSNAPLESFLICRSALRLCGFPLEKVSETTRILPVDPFPKMPSFLTGVSKIRGETVPVVNLAALLGHSTHLDATRYVTVNLGERLVAFAVESIIGVRHLNVDSIQELPPLLSDAKGEIVAAIATLDAELLILLQRTCCFPENIWETLSASEKSE
jgi:purine-binding chemotaxis protein CheW